jgi:hypothetical protein
VLRVAIQVTNLTGERYWAYDTPLPPQVQIAVNINIVGLDQMTEEHKKNRPPPQTVIQAVSNIAMAEVIIMSKSLGIPPPLPPIGLPSEASPTQPTQRKEPRYTT